METVTISPEFQVVIPKTCGFREEAAVEGFQAQHRVFFQLGCRFASDRDSAKRDALAEMDVVPVVMGAARAADREFSE
jgi:hypothetical protein